MQDITEQRETIVCFEVPSWGEINISVKHMMRRKKEAPQDWRDAIFVSQHKKGSKLDCGNFRGISLLSNVRKISSRIILD